MTSFRSADALREHLDSLGVSLPIDESVEPAPSGPLAQPIELGEQLIGNRFCILPMEGWDGTADGKPTDLTTRRWHNFGASGAKLIWGGEAVAVRHDGRANPNQLLLSEANVAEIASLRQTLIDAHEQAFGRTDDLLVGLQLTHSGRYAKPNKKTVAEPRIVYRHPVLDRRVDVDDDNAVLSDSELDALCDDSIVAAKRAERAGFSFVDIKHCHGYLGHELLTAYDRPGAYGGDLLRRTSFLRRIVTGIRAEAPTLQIAVRLSAFDFAPFRRGEGGVGIPEATGDYRYAFGGGNSGTDIELDEADEFLGVLDELDIRLVCLTAGSPYYNPHIQRPAAYPPSDGYLPPEDPVVGVARQIAATAELKRRRPELTIVGSGYSYLQDWLPNVAQAVVRDGMADSIGLGRMVLSYHDLPADVLGGKSLQRKRVCRTFSDCTTAPRNGMVSGCYPLDAFYKSRPERKELATLRAALSS